MPAASISAEVEVLYPQVLRRLVETGEWDRYFAFYLFQFQLVLTSPVSSQPSALKSMKLVGWTT